MAEDLAIIKNELSKELKETRHNLPAMDNLVSGKFDSTTYDQVSKYLEILKKFYVNRYNAADHKKEEIIFSLTSTPEKKHSLTGSGKHIIMNPLPNW